MKNYVPGAKKQEGGRWGWNF